MGPLVVVAATEVAEDHPRLEQVGQGLSVQHLVPETAVERLGEGVLPRAAGLDVHRSNTEDLQPVLDRLSDEFRAIVAPDVLGGSSGQEEVFQGLNDPL